MGQELAYLIEHSSQAQGVALAQSSQSPLDYCSPFYICPLSRPYAFVAWEALGTSALERREDPSVVTASSLVPPPW